MLSAKVSALAGAGVIRRGGEIPGPELRVQVLEQPGRGIRGFVRIAPFVHPLVHLEAVEPARSRHELPHADGFGPRDRTGRKSALDQAEVDHVFRNSLLAEPVSGHSFIAGHAAQPDAEAIAGGAKEIVDIGLYPAVAREGFDVDVECG
jgi:hypothetical protein